MKKHLLSPISYLLSPICRSGGRSRRTGFTLIEMLVVIVIIVILMGVVFRMSRGVLATNDIAQEERMVQVWKSLIEEFYDEYGCYPPVPNNDDGVQPIAFTGPCPCDGEDFNTYYNRHDPLFVFGLSSFFVNRAEYAMWAYTEVCGTENGQLNGAWDPLNERKGGLPYVTGREKNFLKRVRPIRVQIGLAKSDPNAEPNDDESTPGTQPEFDVSDPNHTVGFHVCPLGPWNDCRYVYISEPPYSSYIFFSKGPDNEYDEKHPDDPTRPKNRDNIYGTLLDK